MRLTNAPCKVQSWDGYVRKTSRGCSIGNWQLVIRERERGARGLDDKSIG